MSYKKIIKHVDYKKNGWGHNSMTPSEITVHNTANDAPAKNERDYMARVKDGGDVATYHYAVDDKEAYECIPLNVNGWHSGDGNGNGNRKSLAIEICYSKSGGSKFNSAEINAIELVAKLCKDFKISSSKIYFHKDRSGKNCPHRTLTTLGLSGFRKEVDKILNGGSSSGGGSTSTKSFNQCYYTEKKKWVCQKTEYNDPCPIKIPTSVLTGNKLNKKWNDYKVNTEFRTYDCNKSSTKKTLVLDKNCDDNGLASMYKDFNCTQKISPQLNPKKFGGLTYNILEDKTSGKARRVKIKTEQLGTGWVTVIMNSGEKLKGRDIK